MEPVDLVTALGVVGTFAGQVLIARPPFLFGGDQEEWDAERISGIIFALMSSIFRAFSFLLVTYTFLLSLADLTVSGERKMDSKVPSIIISNYLPFLSLFVSIPFLPTGYPKAFDSHLSMTDVLLYIGTSTGHLNQIFIIRSFQIGPAVKSAILSLSHVLMMVALGVVVRSESFSPLQAIGATLLLASISLVIIRKNTRQQFVEQENND